MDEYKELKEEIENLKREIENIKTQLNNSVQKTDIVETYEKSKSRQQQKWWEDYYSESRYS